MSAPARAAARPLIAVLHAYQRWISPGLPPRCRFHPTCSAYAVEALQVHGLLVGAALAAWRLLKCAPWHPGGVDPVPPRRAPGRRSSPDGSCTSGPRTRPAGNDEEQAPC